MSTDLQWDEAEYSCGRCPYRAKTTDDADLRRKVEAHRQECPDLGETNPLVASPDEIAFSMRWGADSLLWTRRPRPKAESASAAAAAGPAIGAGSRCRCGCDLRVIQVPCLGESCTGCTDRGCWTAEAGGE